MRSGVKFREIPPQNAGIARDGNMLGVKFHEILKFLEQHRKTQGRRLRFNDDFRVEGRLRNRYEPFIRIVPRFCSEFILCGILFFTEGLSSPSPGPPPNPELGKCWGESAICCGFEVHGGLYRGWNSMFGNLGRYVSGSLLFNFPLPKSETLFSAQSHFGCEE